MRYFPLRPRLQRLFMSSKTAKFMRWHAEERLNDGILRHPTDSLAWKDFDQRNITFADEVRNVRLGLASDGFNPFRTMNIVHSTWPVVLIPYNFPPWICMKQPYLILSVLIDSPKGPGDKIDVYMQPLVDELKMLWDEGIQTFDASCNQMFQMRATLLWTINDFPAYANLSGWSTKGEYACPCCNSNTQRCWLKHGKKFSYMGHRRFLPNSHKFRKDKLSFDGKREWGCKPERLSGDQLLQQLEKEGILTEYKRADLEERNRRQAHKERGVTRQHNWKKKSILFELPYWKHNLIRHNLDVMHIEKNVCDNVLWTLLGTAGKSKDNLNARRDLQEMNIRKPLHPLPSSSNKLYLPPTQFALTKDDKDVLLKVLKEVRVPDGYASNISRRVRLQDKSIWGLKSHDSHILMQQLIPLAIRKTLPKNVVEPLIELSNFFRQLCSKMNSTVDLEYLKERITLTLCHLEKIFPPAFFDIMVHLPIHLAEEALIAGAVQFRWMYPIERYLLTLKQYVRNRARPEASMAKGYLMEECMNFCAQYLQDVETKSNRPARNYEGSENIGHAVGGENTFILDDNTLVQAHRYILFNTESIEDFKDQHIEVVKNRMPGADAHQIQRVHFETFHTWFMEHVQNLRMTSDVTFSEEINRLADGPQNLARRFKAYVINGCRFRVNDVDKRRATQNSGVALKAATMSYASRKDKNPRLGAVYYYGQLTDIIEIRYTNDMKYILFKCDWVDNNVGKMEDPFKFTLVNFNHLLYREDRVTNEPFILACQAVQVWYVPDPLDPAWQVVVKMTPRDLFDMSSNEAICDPYVSQQLDTNDTPRQAEAGLSKTTMPKRRAVRPKTMFELLRVRTSQSNNTNTSSPTTLPQSQQPPSLTPPTLPQPQQSSSSSGFTSQSVNESQSTNEFGPTLSNSTHTRGTAKGIKEWGTGVQIKVDFDDKFQPVGKNAAALNGQLGQIVGNGRKVSLTYADWPAVPDNNVNKDIWDEVKDNLVDVPDGYKEVCLRSCNMLWKDRKSKLKRKWFTPHMDDPDLSSKVPKNIVPDQWRELVEYFRSDYAKDVAARNASNREMRGPTHTTGRTHFAQIRDRMAKEGKSTDKFSVFIETRDKTDSDVKELIEYEQRLSDYAESERIVAIRDKIFHELMGEDGHEYCRTYGSGIHRSAVYERDKQSSSISTNDMISTEIARQVNEALAKVKEEFNKEVEAMRARIIYLESERGHHVDASGQAQDATSVRESVGDGSTPRS
ncbi:uncharacterized protein LOC120002208 isoform X2 [Tripterygium wilfordii]|uniref:uncharacterized protein LOC120002208 isoform X2 n=1 Tax=Tripterygium wilfordii TaxID=458696 RepID=UPI0018F7FCFE|nr:uncharacterized protein LOC120002208 isoform X2 [Tripterygium wilfordii]